ncbi:MULTISPECIES: glycosyltransferase family A protein [Planktothricoides]|uniref:Glycosyltransferase family A protein n=1 Tax=Planktothricoides raciborskii GIHE-MW2 TaxID=2792601 RepID=A0AAU8JFZ8_9CYAN|nr:glycosyltransferase family A protein [Planktothricoides sp. SR001]KOR35909.1 hypothetical protein AM228_15675 [Planktothricoides sp. SR001]
MSQPVDLLLITWNRREYLEKTIPNLLSDPSDFRLYCWDNGSRDGTADLLKSLQDCRVVQRHFNQENVGQYDPCMWFLQEASSDIVGKVDDDILLPQGWTERIAPMLRKEPKFGMLGCWIFMPEDWDENLAHKNIIELSNERVFRTLTVQGQSFLARKEYLIRYKQTLNLPQEKLKCGLPVHTLSMSLDGLVSGYPVPLLYAHNMDDPRSPMNVKTKSGTLQSESALSARNRGFQSVEDYTAWITADARRRQKYPFYQLLAWKKLERDNTLIGKIKRKLLKPFLAPK